MDRNELKEKVTDVMDMLKHDEIEIDDAVNHVLCLADKHAKQKCLRFWDDMVSSVKEDESAVSVLKSVPLPSFD